LTRQFENEANADIHSRTTAVEILADFPEGLDYWVTGFGTGGTLKGVARVLKQRSPRTRIVVCEPDNSQTYGSATRIPWPADGVPKQSHPQFRPHPVQGWAPDFVPRLAEDAREHVDQIVPISGAEALELARTLAVREGILTGISGGATLAGALAVCASAEAGARVLCMLPDTGERYLSTPLFDTIAADMNEEEIAVSHSTPSSRFDRAPDVAPTVGDVAEPTAEARRFVRDVVESAAQPVVLFALTWCEFTWAVRKLFKRCGIAYRAVDLDGVAYQNDNWGGKIRAALTEHSGMPTIPQLFVGGKLVGGASETFTAFAHGRLQALLTQHGVPFQDTVGDQLSSLMPSWVQPSSKA
jgi:cysteine synthase A